MIAYYKKIGTNFKEILFQNLFFVIFCKNLSLGTHTISIVTTDKEITSTFSVIDNMTIVHNGVIPEGGVYYTGKDSSAPDYYVTPTGIYTGYTTKLMAGEEFPEPQTGDIYVYQDYEYRFHSSYEGYDIWFVGEETTEPTLSNEWGVTVLDRTKTKYSAMLTTIANKDVTSLTWAYEDCSRLQTPPIISQKAKYLNNAFEYCSSLKTPPILPETVINLYETFFTSGIETPPNIPESITSLAHTFLDSALKIAPIIPDSVTNLDGTFSGTPITIPPVIPNRVTNMNNTFGYCYNLTTAPTIPSSVTTLINTFSNCYSLTGTVELNANLSSSSKYANIFSETELPITLTGSSTVLTDIAQQYDNVNILQ